MARCWVSPTGATRRTEMNLADILGLIEGAPDAPLGRLVRGAQSAKAGAALRGMTVKDLLGSAKNDRAARAVLAGVWAAADGFEEAHGIAQEIEGEWGDWWHAILHRREPDYPNAMYWYRKVRAPAAVWSDLGQRALAVLGPPPPPGLESLADSLQKSGHWEPGPYVRLCEQAQAGTLTPAATAMLVALQRLEWRTWLDHCHKTSISG